MFNNISAIIAFCDGLREARAFKGYSVAEVVQKTRISQDYLTALENGYWDDIPAAYLRGYLASYAKAVGMNHEKVLKTYDLLTSPIAGKGGAILESGNPLLNQPQHVGITRAKIRTNWFAIISQNRFMSYIITLFVLSALFVVLFLSRRMTHEITSLLPFKESHMEYLHQIHGPLTFLSSNISDTIANLNAHKWLTVIGSKKGRIQIQSEDKKIIWYNFSAYDTIILQYDRYYDITIKPALSAIVYQDSSQLTPESISKHDEAFYIKQKYEIN